MAKEEVNLEPGLRVQLTSLRTRRKVECRVEQLLGVGGTAKVYAGTLSDGGQVVLKAQRTQGVLDPAFELEVELFKKLFHRNVVHCVGVGTTPGQYLVLGFRRAYPNPLLLLAQSGVDEAMRRDRRARYPNVPIDTAIDFGYELLNALDYLERLGFVHHDVKLSNVLVDVAPRERPLEPHELFGLVVRREYRGVLIDFGATRSRGYLEAWNQGQAPKELGPQITPFYAPPESLVERRQDDGNLRVSFDPSLDVYAAALVLYVLVTGHPPYSHLRDPVDPNDIESVIGVKSAERRGEIEPISQEVLRRTVFEETRFVSGDRASFDQAFFRFLQRRLLPEPGQRGTAAEMKKEFEKICAIRPTQGNQNQLEASGRRRVFLPFQQELVVVGGKGEHPLLRAARAYGLGSPETSQVAASPSIDRGVGQGGGASSGGGSSGSSSAGAGDGLGWLADVGPGPGSERQPERSAPSSRSGQGEAGRGTRRHAPEQLRALANELTGSPPARPPAPPGRARRPHPDRAPRRAPRSAAPARVPTKSDSGRILAVTRSGAGGSPAAQRDPTQRSPLPAAEQGGAWVLVSAVIGDPVLLSRSEETVIGRESGAGVRIKSDLVSRRHASIRHTPGGFVVEDLKSLNGTFVNGHRLKEPCPLRDGDRISLGGFEVIVRVLTGDVGLDEGGGGTTRIMVSGGELAKRLPPASFSGELGQLRVRDVIEILEWKQQSGVLHVAPPNGSPGRMFLADGQVIHAEAGGQQGLGAARRLLQLDAGRFSFAQGRPRCPRTIQPDNAQLWPA